MEPLNIKTEMDTSSTLTEEQRSFLETCEQEFSSRYTDSDREYEQTNKSGPPPIVEPWYSKPRRNYDWANKRNDRVDRYSNRNNQSTNRSYDGERDRYRRY